MTKHPTTQLQPADKEAFWRDGAIALRGVIAADWLAVLADAIEADIANPGPYYHGYEPEDGHGRFHGNLRTWEIHEGFRRFCMDSPAADYAQAILGAAKINLLYDQLFVKEPGTSNPTRWHNDQPYWPIKGHKVLSIWVALDPTTKETGALEFIRGSHLWGRLFQPETFGRTSVMDYERNPDYEPMFDVEAQRDQYDIISFDLAPGDVYVFHALTMHGAGGNQARNARRRGYTVRYTGDDIRYSGHPGVNAGLYNPSLADGSVLDSDQYPVVRDG